MSRTKPLYSRTTGSGPIIVMVHGYLASSHYFRLTAERLSVDHTVIVVDLLGFGKSPKPKSRHTYEAQVDALHGTITSIGIKTPFVLLGHSMGALVALRYATIYPQDVVRLQLFNPPVFTSVSQAIETFQSTSWQYRALLHSPFRTVYWRLIKILPRNISDHRKAINITDILRASTRAREDGYRTIVIAAELFRDLHRTQLPVLFVVGEKDRPIYQYNLTTRVLPATVHVELVDSGHHFIVKNPDQSEQLIRRHLIQ